MDAERTRLLRHLENVGLAAAPQVIGSGFDARGRETVAYIDGSFDKRLRAKVGNLPLLVSKAAPAPSPLRRRRASPSGTRRKAA